MTRYAQGRDANLLRPLMMSNVRLDENGVPLTNQKAVERKLEASYGLFKGERMKGLTFRLRQATTRATDLKSDLDEGSSLIDRVPTRGALTAWWPAWDPYAHA